jgi:23S rRNA pseudouridine2604 synthase
MNELIRINKRLAELGIASRREADRLLEEGVVFVDGKKAVIGEKVSTTAKIDVRKDTQEGKLYLAYYKGRGIISHSPAEHETDIKTRLEADYGLTDVFPIGRLDKDSEGLLIITNDGRLTAPLLDSQNAIEKEYEVSVDKSVTSAFLHAMERGVKIERYHTRPAKTKRLGTMSFLLTITEGKKHQIRRMCAALGYQVQSLKRIRVAHITLGDIKPNQYRKLTPKEVATLLQLL